MGTALLKGWLRNESPDGDHDELKFSACVRSQASLERLEKQFYSAIQKQCCSFAKGDSAAARMAAEADVVILGCAPSDYDAVLRIEGMPQTLETRIVVSLLAGVSYQQLIDGLLSRGAKSGDSLRLARVLPTLGARIGDSVSLLAGLPQTEYPPDHTSAITSLFGRIGSVDVVPENLFAETTALGATCHALTIVAADTLADASAADGIPRNLALNIVARCLQSANGLLDSGMTTAELKDAMAIPTGITINTVLQLEREARPAIADSLRHAISYTRGM